MTVLRASAVAACLFLGCALPTDPPLECVESSTDVRGAGALTIGTMDDAFAPLADGDRVELVLGTQGGWMVLPSLELALDPSSGEDQHACVDLRAEVAENGDPIASRIAAVFSHDGVAHRAGPFPFFLSFDVDALDGRTARLVARVSDAHATIESSVDVVLVNDE